MDGASAPVDRIMTRLLDGPAVCVECLVTELALPEERARQATTDFVATGVLTERPDTASCARARPESFRRRARRSPDRGRGAPGLDGVETFRQLRALDASLPVIIVTGFPDSRLLQEALAIGQFTVLAKPVGLQHLRSAVGMLLGRSACCWGGGSLSSSAVSLESDAPQPWLVASSTRSSNGT
jgi:DNA-binding NarL/FixJ family response regulator